MAAMLKLDIVDTTRIGRFVERYLDLNDEELGQYDALREDAPVTEKEAVTEILTYWERKGLTDGLEKGRVQGIEEGIERGLKQGRLTLLLKLLKELWRGTQSGSRDA